MRRADVIVHARRGLTLMELVVVLAILVATATAATVATERVLYQRRFEITRETLDSLGSSVLGKSETAVVGKPTTEVDGFIADMGRLPVAIDADVGLRSAELWTNARSMQPYARKQSAIDPDIWLSCGWRGPYVSLPLGGTSLVDGWGRPILPLMVDGFGTASLATVDQPIAGWLSYGSDGTEGMSIEMPLPNSQDLVKPLWTISAAAVKPLWTTDITVVVNQLKADGTTDVPQGSGTLTIRLFGPNPTTGEVAAFASLPLDGPFTTNPSATFPAVALGPKVLRAYYSEHNLRSTPLEVVATRTGTTQWTLTLPAPPTTPPETP